MLPWATVGEKHSRHGGLFTHVKNERLNHLMRKGLLVFPFLCLQDWAQEQEKEGGSTVTRRESRNPDIPIRVSVRRPCFRLELVGLDTPRRPRCISYPRGLPEEPRPTSPDSRTWSELLIGILEDSGTSEISCHVDREALEPWGDGAERSMMVVSRHDVGY